MNVFYEKAKMIRQVVLTHVPQSSSSITCTGESWGVNRHTTTRCASPVFVVSRHKLVPRGWGPWKRGDERRCMGAPAQAWFHVLLREPLVGQDTIKHARTVRSPWWT